jgi:hypothetical protein
VRHKDPCDHRNMPQNVVPDKGQLGRVDPENYTPHACQKVSGIVQELNEVA